MLIHESRLRRFANLVYPLYAPIVHRIFKSDVFHHTAGWTHVTWLGNQIYQDPVSLWTLQETIAEIRPQLILETGTDRGVSALFFAQLLDLLEVENSRVITVDIKKKHSLNHPRITWLIGSSTGTEIVREIRASAETITGPVMAILDSDHSTEHVAAELEIYHGLVTPGSFLHVQDGYTDHWGRPQGPLRAIIDFLRRHPEFEVDEERCHRFVYNRHPMGWLYRRAKPG